MRFDLHLHTFHSPDSLTSYEAVIAAVQRRRLDGIAVTDHNTIRGALDLAERAPFPVIVAEEVRTAAGEVIGYFLCEEIPRGLSLDETIDRIRVQGGVISVPHPVDRVRRASALGMTELLRAIDRVDALEVLNARCTFTADNQLAAQVARQHGKLVTAGSDAHAACEIGQAFVELAPFDGPECFLESLKQARIAGRMSLPWVRLNSAYAKIARKLRGRREWPR
ncbi:MAG: PHP domain-containing protein [Ardenticatenaceae bacterium]|nr:PHP domain-containing protein [Ardenticatenaceae bacterium]